LLATYILSYVRACPTWMAWIAVAAEACFDFLPISGRVACSLARSCPSGPYPSQAKPVIKGGGVHESMHAAQRKAWPQAEARVLLGKCGYRGLNNCGCQRLPSKGSRK